MIVDSCLWNCALTIGMQFTFVWSTASYSWANGLSFLQHCGHPSSTHYTPPTKESVRCALGPWTLYSGLTSRLTFPELECSHCHRMAKSNPMQPPAPITPPEYPFQLICSDYFNYDGQDYVVIVDRYSNWPMVYRSESGAAGLVKRLRETFVTFGVPEELTSDGGPQFTAGQTQEFLRKWGVRLDHWMWINSREQC